MTVLTTPTLTTTWGSPTVLATDTFVQCHAGRIAVTSDAAPAGNDGVILSAFQGLTFAKGLTLQFRLIDTPDATITLTAVGTTA